MSTESQSQKVINGLRDKAASWKASKEKEIIRQVLFFKNITTRSNKLSSTFLNSSYSDVVKQIENIKALG